MVSLSFRLGVVIVLLLGCLMILRPQEQVATASFSPLEELSPQEWSLVHEQLRQEGAAPSSPQTEGRKLLASDGLTGDFFGWAMTLSGDTLVVAAWQDDHSVVLTDAGSVYIFYRNQGGANRWGQVKKLVASDVTGHDGFGHAVALDGDTLVVGAPLDDDNGLESGSAYVFERNAGGANNWGQVKKLLPGDGVFDDQFGRAVAISASTIVIGSWLDGDEGTNYGSVYVFERDLDGSNNWGQSAKLEASDPTITDYFGGTVGISLDTIVVSSIGDDARGSSAGAVYLFDRSLDDPYRWQQVKKILASDGRAGDQFGFAVDISSDTIVVGAPGSDTRGKDAGAVYFYGRHQGGANTWGLVAKRTASDAAIDDFFGAKVALSRDTVIVGSPTADEGSLTSTGVAYVFERNLGGVNNWGEMARLTAADFASGDYYGYAVEVDVDTVVIGAYGKDDRGGDSGAVYLYELIRNWNFHLPITIQP